MAPYSGPTVTTPELAPYLSLLAQSPTLALMHDTQGLLLGVSPSIADLLNAAPISLVGTPLQAFKPPERLGSDTGRPSKDTITCALNWQATDLLDANGNAIPTFMDCERYLNRDSYWR